MIGAGPCMCGGCRRCLHDQGHHCGDVSCCGPTEPLVLKVRFDAADYSWEGEEDGYRGHPDRLIVAFYERRADGRLVEWSSEAFDFDFPCADHAAGVILMLLEWVEEEHESYFKPRERDDYDYVGDDLAYDADRESRW